MSLKAWIADHKRNLKRFTLGMFIGVLAGGVAYTGLPPTQVKGQSETGSKVKFTFQAPYYQQTDLGGVNALIETGNNNIIKDPGFESASAAANWTTSGGATSAITTNAAHVASGKQAYDWDSNGAAQTLTGTVATLQPGLYARNAEISCNFKCPSGTCTHTLNAYDGSANLSSTTITSSATYVRTTTNFVMPSSGLIYPRVTAVAADEPELYVDDCYIGEARNVGSVAQAVLVGSAYFATTASCTFTRTNTALGALSDTDCPGPTVELNPGPGVIQTTDANAPNVTVNNLPPGTYIAHFVGANAIGTGAQLAALAINDGTTTAGQTAANNSTTTAPFHVAATFTYTTTANITFSLYASSAANAFNIDLTASNQRLYFYLEKYPSSAEQAYRPDLANPSGQVKLVDAANCQFSSTSSSYADFAADSDCSAAYSYTGSASAPTSANTPGATFGNIPAGRYLAYATGLFKSTSASGTAAECQFRLYDGTNQITTSSVKTGALTAMVEVGSISALSGIVEYSSLQTSLQLRVQVKSVSGSPTCTIDLNVAGEQLNIGLIPIGTSMNAPILVGSVTSNSTGAERVERANFGTTNDTTACTATPCSFLRQSGNWLTSVSRASTGQYTANIATGIFSSAPTCVATCKDSNYTTLNGAMTTSAFPFASRDAAGTLTDSYCSVICMGPR